MGVLPPGLFAVFAVSISERQSECLGDLAGRSMIGADRGDKRAVADFDKPPTRLLSNTCRALQRLFFTARCGLKHRNSGLSSAGCPRLAGEYASGCGRASCSTVERSVTLTRAYGR